MSKKAKETKEYVATVGMNLLCDESNPDGTRIEAGAVVPAAVLEKAPWLIEQGHVVVKEGEVE